MNFITAVKAFSDIFIHNLSLPFSVNYGGGDIVLTAAFLGALYKFVD